LGCVRKALPPVVVGSVGLALRQSTAAVGTGDAKENWVRQRATTAMVKERRELGIVKWGSGRGRLTQSWVGGKVFGGRVAGMKNDRDQIDGVELSKRCGNEGTRE
jgi:hypothetical protein